MTKTQASFIALLTLWAGTSQATLIDRGSGLIYDDVLKVTWLQDANILGGWSNWNSAKQVVDNLVYGGYDDWRLPTTSPINGDEFNYVFSKDGTSDSGFNITSSNSELAYMFYVNLGNESYYTSTGALSGCSLTPDNPCLDNISPFINVMPAFYWSDTTVPSNNSYAWTFNFAHGSQMPTYKDSYKNEKLMVWAVRDGDVAPTNNPSPIPEPSTLVLLLTGLGLVALRTQSKHATRS